MVHMGIITHHPPLYEGHDQVAMAIQTFIIPLHSFNTANIRNFMYNLALYYIYYYTIPRVMLNYLKATAVLCKRLVKVCCKLCPFIRG